MTEDKLLAFASKRAALLNLSSAWGSDEDGVLLIQLITRIEALTTGVRALADDPRLQAIAETAARRPRGIGARLRGLGQGRGVRTLGVGAALAAAAVIGTTVAAAGGGALVVVGVLVAALLAPALVRYRVPAAAPQHDRSDHPEK